MGLKVSVAMSTFNRPHLLFHFFNSLKQFLPLKYETEFVVVNDGIEDDTLNVCLSFRDLFDIKYIFTGERNKERLVSRNPAIPNNIAVRATSGDILVLTCPEICHFNNSLELLIEPLLEKDELLTIPQAILFDVKGAVLRAISSGNYHVDTIEQGFKTPLHLFPLSVIHAPQMPFFMGLWKKHFVNINGYDEDFTGYAAEDNDLVARLLFDLKYHRVNANVVHLFHGERCDSKTHFENPLWVQNWNLFQGRKGVIKRNTGIEWGNLAGREVLCLREQL